MSYLKIVLIGTILTFTIFSCGPVDTNPFPAAPKAPGGLTATAENPKPSISIAIYLRWQDNSNNEGFFSIEKSNNNSTFYPLDTVNKNITNYTDYVEPMKTYYYRIRVFPAANQIVSKPAGYTGLSNTATVTAVCTVPAAPSTPCLVGGDSFINVSWQGTQGALSYKIFYHTIADSATALEYTGSLDNINLTCTLTELANGLTFYVWVKAVNQAGESDFSPGAAVDLLAVMSMIVDPTSWNCEFPALAIDYNNKVHISYYDNNWQAIKYATNSSGSWQAEVVDQNGIDVPFSSIATDSNNKAHISYCDYIMVGSKYVLNYATNQTGTWSIINVDQEAPCSVNSIVVDKNDKIHISYHGIFRLPTKAYDYLNYATNTSGNWVIANIHMSNYSYTNLLSDKNNKLHMLDHNSSLTTIEHTSNVSGTWSTAYNYASTYFDVLAAIPLDTTIHKANNINLSNSCSLAVDSNHKIHMLKIDYGNDSITYGVKNLDNWQYTIITSDQSGARPAIALDSHNKVHICYADKTNGSLVYATW